MILYCPSCNELFEFASSIDFLYCNNKNCDWYPDKNYRTWLGVSTTLSNYVLPIQVNSKRLYAICSNQLSTMICQPKQVLQNPNLITIVKVSDIPCYFSINKGIIHTIKQIENLMIFT